MLCLFFWGFILDFGVLQDLLTRNLCLQLLNKFFITLAETDHPPATFPLALQTHQLNHRNSLSSSVLVLSS